MVKIGEEALKGSIIKMYNSKYYIIYIIIFKISYQSLI